jgi:cell division protein DivIC
MKKIQGNLPKILKNKYLITAISFLIWMLFFDERDLITTHIKQPEELRKLRQSEKYYQGEIASTRSELEGLKSKPADVEKYAREKYHMKRDNEDLFLINEK